MTGSANGDSLAPRRHEIWDAVGLWQYKREWAWPKAVYKLFGLQWPSRHKLLSHRRICYAHNKRLAFGAALGVEHFCQGFITQRCGDAINGFRRHDRDLALF